MIYYLCNSLGTVFLKRTWLCYPIAMGKYLQELEDRVIRELEKAERQANLTKQSADEISRVSANSPSQSGDREHSRNQAYVTADRLKILQNILAELQNAERDNQPTQAIPPVYITAEIGDAEQKFYILSNPLNLSGFRLVSANSPLGQAVLERSVGEDFEYEIAGNIIEGRVIKLGS